MSNLPIQSAVNHNDDNDEQINSINNKLSTINTRIITTPSLIKRQQNIETKIANNQAYDEIHDLRTKHSSSKKINNDNLYIKNSTQQYQSHELMQGNYYDQTRFVDIDYTSSSSSNHQSEPILIDINVEDYKKTFAPVCTSKNSNNKNRTRSPPFGDTSESIQQGIAQSAGILLELNKKQDNYHQHKTTMKNNNKSHEQAVINYFPNDDDDDNNNNNTKQRSSSSSSSSSDCSTSDSSTSNKCQDDNTQTNIPYEKLSNDEDNDDNNELIETTKKPLTESTILLNKNHSQTYGTQQSTTNIPYERSKYLPNNGYNSHGSSVTTKSSSDNSGSIRTNSGTDNDEESDEEHYNNSTLSNNQYSTTLPRTKDTSIKSLNKTHDIKYSYINEQNNYRSSRLNTTHLEQTNNNDEFHLQVPRMKQLNIDDLNGNVNKLNPITTDHNTILFPSKSSLQQSSNNQTNIPLPSSSHQNRNITEHNEQQQQQQQQHLNSSRNTTTRPNQNRGSKKRKQSQQQEIIRTELIPGHRGDRDVDELVMFIDGDSSKQRQNSTPLRPTDTNKPRLSSKLNSLNDTNSNKTSSRKKSRKSMNILQQTISTTTNNNENQTSNYVTTNEQNIQSLNFIDEDNQTKTHTIIDITNQSLINKNISTDNNNDDESHLNAVDVNSTKIINDESSIPNLFEQTHNDNNTSLKNDDIDLYNLSSIITNNLNSEIISEPFVTVKNRRRLIKERRQDNNLLTRSTHFLPPSTSSKTYDKRRISSTTKNGIIRPILRNNLPNTKVNIASITKEEINNRISSEPVRSVPPLSDEQLSSTSIVNSTNEQNIEKQQISPRLSSHSSSSSLSSLLKRQSKPPPVVFLNKSIDIELNDVSFGFELDSTTLTKSSDDNNIDTNNQLSIITTTEPDIDTSTSLSIQQIQSNDISNDSSILKSPRRFSQRNNRSPQFYSGSDIRPHQQRNYSSQSSYIDPLLLVQYNQQRLANYSQQLAYMNYLRTHYIPPQSPYVLLPTTYTTTTTTTTNEIDHDETTNSSTSEQIQEPLYVYSTPTGQFYFHPSTTKKSSIDTEQQSNSMPTVYTPTIYPSHYFYPSHTQHLIPSQTAYFQPISSSSSLIDTKSEQNNIDIDDDDGYKNSSILYHQTRQQSSSSDIMSNALQLVYSQQRRNAQTDRFNLDDLTAYLAMKWTDTVDHYEQGDNRILLVNEQE
ncbi:unnamed protein product [Rotaria sordida]|uniref:Uncharacterized protein n=2 Tax=Rotaria sordida TaxID=392033 RepID=A0A818G7W3_9BILA|nr:unnamed protein product [Rotaria sordida]